MQNLNGYFQWLSLMDVRSYFCKPIPDFKEAIQSTKGYGHYKVYNNMKEAFEDGFFD